MFLQYLDFALIVDQENWHYDYSRVILFENETSFGFFLIKRLNSFEGMVLCQNYNETETEFLGKKI